MRKRVSELETRLSNLHSLVKDIARQPRGNSNRPIVKRECEDVDEAQTTGSMRLRLLYLDIHRGVDGTRYKRLSRLYRRFYSLGRLRRRGNDRGAVRGFKRSTTCFKGSRLRIYTSFLTE